jgi:uncharacterized surface protein with fasciclin (FAS1) repeats
MKGIKTKLLLLLITFSTVFVSCDKTELDQQTLPSLTSIFESNAELGSLSQAIAVAGLTETLNGTDEYTIFAPSDAAFTAYLSSKGFTSINDVPTPFLREILLNHVIAGKLKDVDLPASGYLKTLAMGSASTTNTLSMYVNKADGVRLNGISSVTTANINASNGVIHIVDAVIDFPTIVTHVTANPNFSTLVSALTRNDQPDFVTELSSSLNAPYTVFAPYNFGFSNFLTEYNYSGLSSIPQNVLEQTLKNHVVLTANALSSTLSNNQVIPTYANDNLMMIINNEGINVKDSNNREANVPLLDIQCSNGVIHGIDKVLVPSFD